MRVFTPTAYAAIMRTLQRGGLYVARDPHCGLATITAIGRRHGIPYALTRALEQTAPAPRPTVRA